MSGVSRYDPILPPLSPTPWPRLPSPLALGHFEHKHKCLFTSSLAEFGRDFRTGGLGREGRDLGGTRDPWGREGGLQGREEACPPGQTPLGMSSRP